MFRHLDYYLQKTVSNWNPEGKVLHFVIEIV
jgi:hypothetical protein